jgi:DNA-binding PadR family transcriptional regulator
VPRTTQTEMAVLGALSVMPMSGYALRSAIHDVLGHFWSESFGQIYPTLADLAERGLVRREGAARPGSSTFMLTDAGLTRLRELLAEPPQTTPPRNGLLLRLFFGRQLGLPACRALLLDAKADAEARVARFQALRDEVAHDDDVADERPFFLLTISAGEHSARAALAWAEESLAVLDSLQTLDAADPDDHVRPKGGTP